jgi:hypothetical protein
MKEKILVLKHEFEKFVNSSSVLERGLILNKFSFGISKEIDNLLDNLYDYIYGISFSMVLPFSDDEHAYLSVSHNLKEPMKEENIAKVFEISNTDKRPSFRFIEPDKAFIEISFAVYPAPENFIKNLEGCKEHIIEAQNLSNHFALVRLIIKDFMIDFSYYGKVL